MGQFSPRIVRALLDDRGDQFAIAVFGATFTFALFSLRAVDTGPGGEAVPGVTVLDRTRARDGQRVRALPFVHHAGQQLRVGALVDLVGDELRGQLERRYPAPGRAARGRVGAAVATRRQRDPLDRDALVAEARRAGCTLELVPMMGDFVIPRRAARPRPGRRRAARPRARRRLVALDDERTHARRPCVRVPQARRRRPARARHRVERRDHGRAGVNRLHDCLRQIAARPFPNGHVRDDDGELRLIERVLDWDGYVRLAFDEIRLAAGGYPQVTRRLKAALADLKAVAPPERKPPLDRQLRLLEARRRARSRAEDDLRAALVADAQGIGSGADIRDPLVGGASLISASTISRASFSRSGGRCRSVSMQRARKGCAVAFAQRGRTLPRTGAGASLAVARGRLATSSSSLTRMVRRIEAPR